LAFQSVNLKELILASCPKQASKNGNFWRLVVVPDITGFFFKP
jgi:hypothetical protein